MFPAAHCLQQRVRQRHDRSQKLRRLRRGMPCECAGLCEWNVRADMRDQFGSSAHQLRQRLRQPHERRPQLRRVWQDMRGRSAVRAERMRLPDGPDALQWPMHQPQFEPGQLRYLRQ